MKHCEFSIGAEFFCGGNRWECTDLGQRVVIAIPVNENQDPSWRAGPPYAVAEAVFDEFDIEGCSATE
jgi:hypothetical protein